MSRYGRKEFRIGEYWIGTRKDSPAYFRCWYDDRSNRTHRVSLGTKDFREACDKLREWYVGNYRPQQADADQTPIATVLRIYYEEHASKKPSGEPARYALRYWNDFYEGKVVSDITPTRQKEFAEWLVSKELSGSYIRRTIAIGQAALNRAYKFQQIKWVPYILSLSHAPRQPRHDRFSGSVR